MSRTQRYRDMHRYIVVHSKTGTIEFDYNYTLRENRTQHLSIGVPIHQPFSVPDAYKPVD